MLTDLLQIVLPTVFDFDDSFVVLSLFNANDGRISLELCMKAFESSFIWECDAYHLFVRESFQFRK